MTDKTNFEPTVFSLRKLSNSKEADPFRSLTFPAYRNFLEFNALDGEILAIGAIKDDTPCGLILLKINSVLRKAELLSIFITPRFRKQGIALLLMQKILAECKILNLQKIFATYMNNQITIKDMEGLLKKTGWSPPLVRMLVVHCTLESIHKAPWLNRFFPPKGYQVVSWASVTKSERAALIASNIQTPWIQSDLVPFDYEKNYDQATSVALKVNGAILGWCLTHAVAGTLRFTCSFVRNDLQRLGRIILLYDEAVARMSKAGYTVGMWTIPVTNKRMIEFARKHMQPYSIIFAETRGVEFDF